MVFYLSLRSTAKMPNTSNIDDVIKNCQQYPKYFCRFCHNFYKVSCLHQLPITYSEGILLDSFLP